MQFLLTCTYEMISQLHLLFAILCNPTPVEVKISFESGIAVKLT